ncbi:hypothetical protein C2G38_1242647 [Gigaspora rosea]|uniref:Uncharacterized protein n=1 Tax=Gigaspora rosea TaxID=44941 RepID=A0A397VCN4_9GLOM|nr:hypothetical protein C2G38_1242647 [Gigaspora rosea]
MLSWTSEVYTIYGQPHKMSRLIFVGVFLIVSISRVLAYPYFLSPNEEFNVNDKHPKYHEQLDIPYWVKVIITVVLVLLGGLFAGKSLRS